MLEIPECQVLAGQLNQTVMGKTILNVEAAHSPHKFTWYTGDPAGYHGLLTGRTVGESKGVAGYVEIAADGMRILFQDGVNLRLIREGDKLPAKHQLLIEFEDHSYLAASVQMYGGVGAFKEGENDNPYYRAAREKPSPLSDDFSSSYFEKLCRCEGFDKLSAKAFLATEQRIPGLGNGVLQDILFRAGLHPKRKMGNLSESQLENLFGCVKSVLLEMTLKGGRNTERDLFGGFGGYLCTLSRNTLGTLCPKCATPIKKEAYLGGSIYLCENCQPIL